MNLPPIRIAAFGDLHLTSQLPYTPPGDIYRTDQLTKFFEYAFETIVKKKVDFILDAGDLFHETLIDSKTLDLLSCITELSRIAEIPNIRIPGNHDFDGVNCFLDFLERLNGRSKIFYFDPKPAIWEFSEKKLKIVAIPYCSDKEFLENARKGKRSKKEEGEHYNILLAHIGIKGALYGDTVSPHGVDLKDIKNLSNGYDLMIFGHFHKFQTVGNNGIYTGSIQHTRIDQHGEIPGFVIIDLPTFRLRHISNEFSPRFTILKDYVLDSRLIRNNIVKPLVDIENRTEEQNIEYLKKILTFDPYYLIRPNLRGSIGLVERSGGGEGESREGVILKESKKSKEDVIKKVLKGINVSDKLKQKYERYIVEFYREVADHE